MKIRKELVPLVAHAIADKEFRARLITNAQKTASEIGVQLTEEEVHKIESLSLTDIEDLIETFDKKLEEIKAVGSPGW